MDFYPCKVRDATGVRQGDAGVVHQVFFHHFEPIPANFNGLTDRYLCVPIRLGVSVGSADGR